MSIHSLYFWPDRARLITEIGRVLGPGGLVVLVLSPGKIGEAIDAGFQGAMEQQVITSLKNMGFTDSTISSSSAPEPARVAC